MELYKDDIYSLFKEKTSISTYRFEDYKILYPFKYYLNKVAESSKDISLSHMIKNCLEYTNYYLSNELPSIVDQIDYV